MDLEEPLPLFLQEGKLIDVQVSKPAVPHQLLQDDEPGVWLLDVQHDSRSDQVHALDVTHGGVVDCVQAERRF